MNPRISSNHMFWVFIHIGCEIWSDSLNRNSTSRLLKIISLLSNCGIKPKEFKVTNLENSEHPSIKKPSLTLLFENFDSPILSHITFIYLLLLPISSTFFIKQHKNKPHFNILAFLVNLNLTHCFYNFKTNLKEKGFFYVNL